MKIQMHWCPMTIVSSHILCVQGRFRPGALLEQRDVGRAGLENGDARIGLRNLGETERLRVEAHALRQVGHVDAYLDVEYGLTHERTPLPRPAINTSSLPIWLSWPARARSVQMSSCMASNVTVSLTPATTSSNSTTVATSYAATP